jgi:hypothetical protein
MSEKNVYEKIIRIGEVGLEDIDDTCSYEAALDKAINIINMMIGIAHGANALGFQNEEIKK